MHQNLSKLSKIMMSLALAGLFGIITILAGLSHTTPPAYAAGETCFVETTGDNSTDYQSADAAAVQQAVNAASPGDLIKIAGTCAGVTQTAGITQTAYLTKNLTMRGGYTTTNWSVSNPDANPTTLSANDLGRVVVISETAQATVENLIVMSGTAEAGGGIYVYSTTHLSLLNSQVMSNTSTGIDPLTDGGGGLGNLGTAVISGTIFSQNQAVAQAGAVGNGASGKMTVMGSTFRDNQAGTAGAVGNTGWMTVTASSFSSNTASKAGAIGNARDLALGLPGWMWIENSTFMSHTISSNGGAIDNTNGEMHILTTTFRANNAKGGGAIYNNTDTPQLYITNTTFITNTAGSRGGGAIRHRAGTVSIDSSTFSGNSTSDDGGAIRVQDDADSTTIANTLIFSNSAVLKGGGIYNNATLSLSQVEILSNTAQSEAGGLLNDSAGMATASQSTFNYNQATNGGGVYNQGQLTVSESNIRHNTASQDGAGITARGVFTLSRSTVAYNIADDDGGGLLTAGYSTLINSTVSHNQALGNNHNVGGGGLIQLDNTSPPEELHLIHTTITSNTANSGDGIYLLDGPAIFTNTIIADNGAENCALEGTSSFISDGYNLEDSNTCALTATTDITDTAALLGPLADNGGETETHALLMGSPAIDAIPAADCAAGADQRGISRPQGDKCDIGAVEDATMNLCFVSLNNSGVTDYQSADASAVQTAINAADSGDTLKIAGTCAGVVQTASLSQTAYISQNLTLQGGYTNTAWLDTPDPETYPTALDAENNGRVVYIASGADVTLAGLTMQNGVSTDAGGGVYDDSTGTITIINSTVQHNQAQNSGGGVANDSGSLTLVNSIVQHNQAENSGGGVYQSADTLTLTNTQILSNNAVSGGGGIYRDFGTTNINNSLISGNTARSGGGIGSYVSTLNVVSSTLQYNEALTQTGGGIRNGAGSLNLIDSLLQHNQTATDGGGYYAGTTTSSGTVISNTTFYSNTATGDGGGLYLRQSLVMSNSTLSENYSGDQGGAGYLASEAKVSFYASQALSNTATSHGGGLYVADGGVLTATNSTLGGNQSDAQGGGLYVNGNNAQILLDETTVYSNSASSSGGGLYVSNTSITLLGGQVISNTSGSLGGGIFCQDSGTAVLSGTQVSYNRGSQGGGVSNNFGGRYLITNTILSHNRATSGDGGAMFLINNGWASLVNSTVFSNTASDEGGGLFNDLGSTTHLTNTTISHNQAANRGGGLINNNIMTIHGGQIISNSVTSGAGDGGGLFLGTDSGTPSLTQTGVLTLAYNQASDSGGGFYVNKGWVQLNGAHILSNQADGTGGAIYQASDTNGISVTNSCLVFNSDTAVEHTGGPTLSATGNWWGADDGPSEAGPGHGDSVNTTTNIDISGFLTSAPAGCPAYTPILTITGGDNQSAEIEQAFAEALTVTLAMDNGGVPFVGEVITFTGPSSGASISPTTIVTATTGSSGLAAATVAANDIAGTYGVTATNPTASNSVTFNLTNTAGIEIYLPIMMKNE